MLNFSVNEFENEYENLGEIVPVSIRFFDYCKTKMYTF
jgi:hypothetical protein